MCVRGTEARDSYIRIQVFLIVRYPHKKLPQQINSKSTKGILSFLPSDPEW